MKNKKISPFIYIFISILYLELVMKYVLLKNIFDIGLVYLVIFILPICLLLSFIVRLFGRNVNKFFMYLLMIIIIVYFEVQLIFFKLFSVPFSFSTIGLAGQALDFVDIVKESIMKYYVWVLLLLVPLVVLIILNLFKAINYNKYSKYSKITMFVMFLLAYGSTFLYLLPNMKESNSEYKLYFKIDDASSIIDRFGFINYLKIDIKRELLGYETEITIDKPNKRKEKKEEVEEEKEIVYRDNVLELDFSESNNKNINSLNNYFSNALPSKQNDYTGMFKDKNLIFILAEGYNEVALDKDRTPTLYKMVNEGFKFTNFYSPVFLSTTGGEFQATTGLIPTQEILSLWKNKRPNMSFSIGNSFGNIGYRVQSFHNWTYTYYKRDLTMKTLGFDNYTGCGNGLEKEMACNWLPSDIDLMNVTAPKYLGQEGNFVTYYVTVSGHSPYNTSDNIAKKYLDQIDEKYSSQVRYYLASQMELDKALEALISNLEAAGELDNTVIAMVGDHYPYTLSINEMNEVSSYTKDEIVEVNRSNFFLWSSSMKESITIDKVGSQIDVLPTLLNLFGINYDSRLIVGKDILSDYEGIAIFSNRSWVSDYGTFFAGGRGFVLKEGKELDNIDEYVKEMNSRVANAFSISRLLLDTKYYEYIFSNRGE